MKQQIYQNGFWLLLGLMLGVSITTIASPKIKTVPTIQIVQDSIVPIDTTKTAIVDTLKTVTKIPLTEENLKAELAKHNIPHAHIVLAQAKLESGNFTSKLTKTHQNIFGLRKGNKYRKYDHWTECVADYSRLISSRYKGGDYFIFLKKIKYAENPNYVKLVKQFI